MKEGNNLSLWNRVSKTDPSKTKEVSFGRKFTAIDPMYQLKKATEEFGLYGEKWGFKEIELNYDLFSKGMIVFKGVFYAPNIEFPIINSASFSKGKDGKIDEDFAKKVETDTLTKALSKLGFNADVFEGKFEDSKYIEELRKSFEEKKKEALRKEILEKLPQSNLDNDKKEKAKKGIGTYSLKSLKEINEKLNEHISC